MTAHRRATILLVATTQFVVLTLVAMTTYAGGTYFDASTRSYRFFENFFSDLGTTRSYSGRPNWVSCVLFVIALATMGSSLVVFSGGWRSFAFERRRGAFFGATGRGLGTLSGICFVGIALTPFDRALDAHNLLVMAAFSLLLGYVGCLTVLAVCGDDDCDSGEYSGGAGGGRGDSIGRVYDVCRVCERVSAL